MHGHLVTVEVRVVGGADERVQLDGLALDQQRLKGLDAEAVQGRGAVEHDRVLADHVFQDIPDDQVFALDHFLGGLDGCGDLPLFQLGVDERLEQLQRHLLGQAALVQLELGADHDDRTAGVVDALAEQVLAETALLALDHVGQGLERAAVGRPVMARPRRPLSNRASTASWSMRFSLRMMISGAPSSNSLLRRLLRLMTRR